MKFRFGVIKYTEKKRTVITLIQVILLILSDGRLIQLKKAILKKVSISIKKK